MKPHAINCYNSCSVVPLDKDENASSPDPGVMSLAENQRRIRLLVLTSLYPDAVRPRHGIFVEERLRHLVNAGRIEATVVAPVPWFPFRQRLFGAYAVFAKVPRVEERHGIRIMHPRYPVIPKLGMNLAPWLMYRALLPLIRALLREGHDFDLLDAHYLYPDGVAAVRIGEAIGKPVVLTARGSDVNVIAHYPRPLRRIRWAAERAAALVTVSDALNAKVRELGVIPEKVTTLRNGVDLDRFAPQDRKRIRDGLGLTGLTWLAVGNLIELKGVHITLEALARVPDVTLLIVGDGVEKPRLQGLVRKLRLDMRVRFIGTVPHAQLADYYNAADVMVLASSREGMPNVVLEALACGTPVVAAPFDGVTELLTAPEAGVIAEQRSAEAIASAWRRLRECAPERGATRAFAERLGWQPVVEAQHALYARVLAAANLEPRET